MLNIMYRNSTVSCISIKMVPVAHSYEFIDLRILLMSQKEGLLRNKGGLSPYLFCRFFGFSGCYRDSIG